ncbi:MAG: pyridoxal-phosphate-dependent aminotransferase family protein [Alphaproteobacteria bacterium]
MTTSHGRGLFMTPGPSVIPDRVLNAMHRAAPNIYEGDLIDSVDGILDNLRKVARTTGNVSIYIANGHGAWEASLHNVIAPGEKVLALATGRFGQGWAETARKMGIEVEMLDFGTTSGFDPALVEVALRADTGRKIKAVMSVQTDTSTSVNNDIPALRAAIDATGHHALLMVDCIASLACERFEMDAWGVDVMTAGCQKGLMTPPGLAFTFHNEKAAGVSRKVAKTSPYWDWEPRVTGDIFYQKFGGTAPTHHLFGLEEALKMLIDEEGIENVWARHTKQAQAIWAALDVWAEGGVIGFNVPDSADRSVAVTTVVSDTANLTELRNWCEGAGLTLGIALGVDGPGSNQQMFRIGHMGHMDAPMLLGALATIDAGMSALQIPKGKGAIDAASAVLAG